MQIIDFIIETFFTYWYISIPIMIILFLYFAYPRRLKYEGIQPTPDNFKRMFTDKVTGTTFLSNHSVIGINKLASRRKKFDKPAFSIPITIIAIFAIIVLLIVLFD